MISDAIIPIPIKPLEVPRKNIMNISEMALAASFWLLSLAQAKGSSVLRNIGRKSIMQIL